MAKDTRTQILRCDGCKREALASTSPKPEEGSVAENLAFADGWVQTAVATGSYDNAPLRHPLAGTFCSPACVANHFDQVAAAISAAEIREAQP